MNNNKALHYYAFCTAVATLLLIFAGGLVTSTQSGLSVPDWPLSYGQVMPPMVGGIFYEHGHRMVATAVGFLTTILAFWLWRKEERKWLRVLGFVALTSVITQGVLGGLTVLFLLPTPISMSHATLAQTFFAIVASITLFTSPWWKSDIPRLPQSDKGISFFNLAALTTGAVYIQLVLGALMRHTQSGLAVPDFPFAYSQLFPSVTPLALEKYNDYLMQNDIRIFGDGPITAAQILIHMTHRLWACVAAGMIAWTTVRILRTPNPHRRIITFGMILPALLIVQITLGAFTVVTQKSVAITTAHVATGAILLVTCVLFTLHVWKLYGRRGNGTRGASVYRSASRTTAR